MSTRSLTGYDNTDRVNGKADSEVYTYDADNGQLTCVSCNPSRARPVGRQLPSPYAANFFAPTDLWAAAWLPTWESQLYASHTLSDDGTRLFFNSVDALLPQDTNGVQDVYEWEADGSGGCEKTVGCLSLISTGQGPRESELVDASPSGDDIFFRTASSIDSRDPGLVDIYDARVNGGFSQLADPTSCVGDACQSPPEPPSDPTPSSASFHGAGNPPARHARRSCRSRGLGTAKKGSGHARRKHTKRCKRANRRAGR